MGQYISLTVVAIIIGVALFWTLVVPKMNKQDPIVELMIQCKFDEAIKLITKTINEGKKSKVTNNNYAVDIAMCYNRMGHFNKSIETMDKINKDVLKNDKRSAYNGLYALNYLMLGMKNQDAKHYVANTLEFNRMVRVPELFFPHFIMMAILEHNDKNYKEAQILIEDIMKQRSYRRRSLIGNFETHRMSGDFRDMLESYLLGLYYEKTGDMEHAKEYYEKVSNFQYANIYKNKAMAALARFGA